MEKTHTAIPETSEQSSEKSLPMFSKYQVFVIVLMALLQFTVVLDFMILSPLGDILMKSMNMSTAQFGTVVSAYAISAGVSGFLAAGFADKFDRKKLLVFFYAGFIIGTAFCGFAYSYETLFLARIVTGLFGGVIGSISMAIVTDVFSLQQRGRVMASIQMSMAGSQILGIPLGLVLANYWGWHSTFYMVVALSIIVLGMVVTYLLPLTEHLKFHHDKRAILHLWHTIKKRDYRIGFFATAMLSMGGFMIMPFTSAFIVNNVLIPQEKLPLIFFFTGISSIIIMPLIGKLSDRYDKFRLFTVGSVIAMVLVLVYTNLPPVHIWVVIVVNMILFMGIMSRVVPAMALNSAIPGNTDRGAYMSINSSLQQLAGGVAAVFAGLIVVQPKDEPLQNFNVLGYIMAGFVLLCIYLVYRMSEMIKARMASASSEPANS